MCAARRGPAAPAYRLVVFVAVVISSAIADSAEENAVASENAMLRKRLQALEEHLEREKQYSYVRANGYLSGADTVFMETMEVAEAKQWCNGNKECKGFTYLKPVDGGTDGGNSDEEEEEEVTITFKGTPESGAVLRVDVRRPMRTQTAYACHYALTTY